MYVVIYFMLSQSQQPVSRKAFVDDPKHVLTPKEPTLIAEASWGVVLLGLGVNCYDSSCSVEQVGL